ncbi:recombinase family protein [uncultured Tateyamaria sp.]|uniref:recombinase family protein n=1 Tax=uncultured Tateyamaria sp. TaxID=455651 RepID=UPI00263372E1|nr:recombinase family protein [uncultured Tateyamaria sp.]
MIRRENFLMGPIQDLAPTARLVGYARVSTEDQKLDMQLDCLKAAGCDKVFYDHGISGGKADRPGLEEALNHVIEGDMLIVYKLDRLGRSVLHLADLLARLDNQDVQFWSLTEGINTATSGGKLIYHIFAAVAEFHRDLIRENTRNGLRAARERGSRVGRPRLMSIEDIVKAHRWMQQEGQAASQIAKRFHVSESTLYRSVRRLSLDCFNPL